jgi:hypothetical protein
MTALFKIAPERARSPEMSALFKIASGRSKRARGTSACAQATSATTIANADNAALVRPPSPRR